ncbi:hypothetical protein SAMN04488100_12116 [Alkalibacterium putridalgicola]|uniref:PRD domain-containing protein n=1 Tax=Alkalibacterium putridalgicola TaxID=426703 RepID=A0A1H7V146_9LACT|nr:hypothetical protein [Alkalibacterium putridalgicola]GEK89689.1 hypothetical protein APU01nite_17280 [Alkalibacterium putridalgicola]SEM02961.1 hypothetical protein SAMN04488100_12116 [Alkalibacterium putridalgicola]
MIQEKLDLLKENKVIDQTAYDYSQEALAYLKKEKVIEEDDDADVLITHLAMATARQNTDEKIEGVDDAILAEIQSDSHYDQAKELWNELKAFAPAEFETNEEGYFHLHLVTLLQEKQ